MMGFKFKRKGKVGLVPSLSDTISFAVVDKRRFFAFVEEAEF